MKTGIGTFQDGLCKTCKHWGEPCAEEPALHCCDHPKTDMVHPEDDCMTVADGEPYNAGVFVTGPNFGCIHHDQK